GAGLLSSFGELGRFENEEELRDWDVEVIANTSYDPTQYQQKLFIAPSFETMANDVTRWLALIK
ncbi:MAG: phenylalanine 4-monooxygenase, partial [Acidobacteria bacterium]|nr:phenylalanine 4-monooxygenase [Acidobacteriota bacterium]